MLRYSGGRRILALALGSLVVLFTAGAVWAQQFTFRGVVYSGVPPDASHPLSGVTVSLYGDVDEWPENGPRALLAETATDAGGAFSLVWDGPSRLYPYYHVQETDAGGAVSTGAVAPAPGIVKNLNTISYVDLRPGTYSGITFWDLPAAGPPASSPGGSLPDLLVSDLGMEPHAPVEGEPLSVRVAIRNEGAVPAPSFDVILRVGEGREPVRLTVEGLAARGETSVRWEIPGLPPGTHHVTAEVDPEGRIPEQREENNVVSREVKVGPGPHHEQVLSLPDLVVVAIDVEPRTVQPGGKATVTVTVANAGTATAKRALVEIRTEAGEWMAAAPLPELAPGERTEVNCVAVFQQEAEVTLLAILDPANEVVELNEENNSGRAVLWVVPEKLPDLAIQGISLRTPLSPVLPWLVSVTLENEGVAPAGAFVISLKQGRATVSAPLLVDGLLPRVRLDVVLFASSLSLTQPLVAVVDAENWVNESDEGNNTSSLSPSTLTLPNLSVTSLKLSVSALQIGSQVTISVEVTNEGSKAVERPEVLITIVDPAVVAAGDENGPWFQFAVLTALPDLEVGASVTSSAVWTPEASGSFIIRAEADPLETLWEADETDNAADLRVTVQGG